MFGRRRGLVCGLACWGHVGATASCPRACSAISQSQDLQRRWPRAKGRPFRWAWCPVGRGRLLSPSHALWLDAGRGSVRLRQRAGSLMCEPALRSRSPCPHGRGFSARGSLRPDPTPDRGPPTMSPRSRGAAPGAGWPWGVGGPGVPGAALSSRLSTPQPKACREAASCLPPPPLHVPGSAADSPALTGRAAALRGEARGCWPSLSRLPFQKLPAPSCLASCPRPSWKPGPPHPPAQAAGLSTCESAEFSQHHFPPAEKFSLVGA